MNKQKSILSFWKDIEIFSLPDLPSKARLVNLDKKLPWELPFKPEEKMMWKHTIYLGKRSKKEVIKVIEKTLGDNYEKQEWEEKATGNTCMAFIILDEHGRLSGQSPYLQASYLHGIKCLQEGQQLSEVNELLEEVQEKFAERHPYNQDAEDLNSSLAPAITAAHLKKEIEILNNLNIPGIKCDNCIYVESTQVSKQSKVDTAFLNSFYLDDLNHLINNYNSFGKGLDNYLHTNKHQVERTDLLANPDAFFQSIDPLKIPAGRWPSNPNHGLYSAQIGAVNTSLSLLKNTGLIGINGPPGTGKTTLLSDIVAEVIVLRAQKLMQKDISRLFDKGQKIEREKRHSYYYPTNSEVFENVGIIVASNNNAAVENISKELPSDQKIDRDTFPNAEYFSEHCQNLIDGNSWGLLAAALGNSENRSFFKNNLWYDNDNIPGFASYLQSLYNNPENKNHTFEHLQHYEKTKSELETLLKEFNKFRHAASEFYQLVPGYLKDIKNRIITIHSIEKHTALLDEILNNRNPLDKDLASLKNLISDIKYSIQTHQLTKPRFFFFHKLFNTRVFKNWNEQNLILLNEHTDLSTKSITVQKEIYNLNRKIANKAQEIKELQAQLEEINARMSIYNNKKERIHKDYGIAYKNIPDGNFLDAFKKDKDAFHKCNPWSSVSINKLRSEIFLKSLSLHKHVILRNAKQIKNNIGLLMELIDGKVQVSKHIALSLWQSFFFCVPVVSTSLASVGRLFSSLGKESIGWLLLDEAGQATPQSAAGIIYRAQRSIIIGDPLQIEPVVTIPHKLIEILKQQHNTDSIWSPLQSSAQILADKITNVGTWMKQDIEDEDIWTGFPLRAHRRCNDPMFSISNEIAYGNQMVKAMEDISFECVLGPSTWFDVNDTVISERQVVEEEITSLKEKIQLLGPAQDIFVISPFKSVADRCKRELNSINSKIQCGTIHKFQGKEADIVFLVLGSDPNIHGSRQWASSKPNMLNVALTRAKRRFYVIGNRRLWSGCNFFSVLAQKL